MKKVLKKISILDELAKEMQVIGIEEQRSICGGSGGSGPYGNSYYPGQGIGDCVIQSFAYMFGLSLDEVHSRMSTILQNSYNYSQTVSDILAGNNLYFEDIENLMYSIAGSCNVNSYNASSSMCALGLIKPQWDRPGHAVVLEFYDASTNTYHYIDPQNNYAPGTILASDVEWVISAN